MVGRDQTTIPPSVDSGLLGTCLLVSVGLGQDFPVLSASLVAR